MSSTRIYTYKGRGLTQITGKQMNIQPITSLSISNTNPSTWPQSSGSSGVTIGNVTLGSAAYSGIHAQALDDTLFNHHYKKYEIYEFEDDVLAVSCAWKRQRDTTPAEFIYSKLTDKKLFDSVNNDDRELARVIRDYYSKKIMMLTLKGNKLTSFRKDLNTYIHGDTNKVTDELLPLIYRLPEFYDYDMKIEEIKLSLEDRPKGAKLEKLHGKQTVFELSPITIVKKHNKRVKVMEYWFEGKGSTPVLIQLEPKNPLLHIWDDIFNSKKVLQISGLPFIKHMDDFEYLSIKNFKLAKI